MFDQTSLYQPVERAPHFRSTAALVALFEIDLFQPHARSEHAGKNIVQDQIGNIDDFEL